MQGPDITFEKLNLSLGNTSILEDIDFKIKAGEIHCLIGPNGGGKTSLIRSLLGQMPHSGTISISNQKDNNKKPKTGYVPQFLEFDKTVPITVYDFMAIVCQRKPAFLGIDRTRRKSIDNALDRVGLIGKRERKLGSLSGGERQRVLFAQALIPTPELLVLDEPMAGMDKVGNEVFEKIVTESSQAGTTVVWIHHDIEQVRRIADTVTCINRRVLFHGPVDQVMTEDSIKSMFHYESYGIFPDNNNSSEKNQNE